MVRASAPAKRRDTGRRTERDDIAEMPCYGSDMRSTKPDLLTEQWRFETRADGVYVAIEEIGGQGELGPFVDVATARMALVAYLRDELPDPLAIKIPRV
jgi:hypothetical protein